MAVGFEFNPAKTIWYGPADEGPMPYVTFEDRAVEDRNATLEDGLPRYKNVVFVKVMSAGSKDTFENVAEAWLKNIEFKVSLGMYRQDWAEKYRQAYEQYRQRGHVELSGTPIRMCSFLNAGEQESCLAANIFTLEGLAACGEEGLKNIGMGARTLQQKAQAFLEQQASGKVALQLAAFAEQLESLKQTLREKDESIEALKQEMVGTRRRRKTAELLTPDEVVEEA